MALPYTVNDCVTELELVYIDDLVNEMLDALDKACFILYRSSAQGLLQSADLAVMMHEKGDTGYLSWTT